MSQSRNVTPSHLSRSVILAAVALLLGLRLAPLLAQSQAKAKPLSKDAVIKLLKGDVSPNHVADLARQRGIDFQMTPETENDLRRAKADEALLSVLRELAAKQGAAAVRPPAPATLVIESMPGGAHVYVDDEPIGTTSSAGKLKISTLNPGEHRVRLSLDGYHDYEQTVNLTSGSLQQITAQLRVLAPRNVRPGGTAPARYGGRGAPRECVAVFVDYPGASLRTPTLGRLAVGNGIIKFTPVAVSVEPFELALDEVTKSEAFSEQSVPTLRIKTRSGRTYLLRFPENYGREVPSDILDAINSSQ